MQTDSAESIDILRWPLIGRLLKWQHSRTILQIPVLLVSLVMIFDGLLGPPLSPKNLATTLTWIHFRGILVFVLLCAGNLFCMPCPFVLVRDLARKLHTPRLNWPLALRNKWISIGLFGGVLYIYEALSLWASPWWTAWLIVGYFAAIVAVDITFKHATFCKFLCPIGQFNFLASTVSPLEVQIRERAVCDDCHTKDCIRGQQSIQESQVTIKRGCELALFLPQKVGNMDCTFCMDCVHACPNDNVGILSRLPIEELKVDPQRSGVGHLLRRADVGALATLFTFGALMNAFGMVSPVYAFERWLSHLLHIGNQTAVLGVVFALVMVLEPAILLFGATFVSLKWAAIGRSWIQVITRYSVALAPLGFGMWLAHYGFHLLTGLYTVVPLTQNAALSVFGIAILGEPRWTLVGLPVRFVQPIEYGFLFLGLLGSLCLSHHYAEEDAGRNWIKVFTP